MEYTWLTNENRVALYRLVLLLEGDGQAAEKTILDVFGECALELAQLRSKKSGLAFAIKKLRAHCLSHSTPDHSPSEGANDTPLFAKQFSSIPEPGRSALALLYLKLFSARDSADLLNLKIEDFARALESARTALRKAQTDSTAFTSEP